MHFRAGASFANYTIPVTSSFLCSVFQVVVRLRNSFGNVSAINLSYSEEKIALTH
jgi:hypothetical protein